MLKKDCKKVDYLILSSIVNSDESESDIVDMLMRFIAMRFQCNLSFPLNIQNPRPVGDETDNRKEK